MKRRGMTVFLCWLLLSISGLKFFTNILEPKPPVGLPVGIESICDGEVTQPAMFGEETTFLMVALSACREVTRLASTMVIGNVRLTVAMSDFPVEVGNRLRFKTVLRQPKGFQNGGEDYLAAHFRRQEIAAVGFISDVRWILRLPMEGMTTLGIHQCF